MYEQERLRVFSANMVVAVIVNIFVASVIVFSSLYENVVGNYKYLWLCMIIAVGCYRLGVHFLADNQYQSKMQMHFAGVVMAGIAWAIFPYIFHQAFSVKEEMVTIVVFCGMAGGGATLLNADLKSSLSFTTITVLPYSILLISDQDPDRTALGILGIGFWMALIVSSYQCAKYIRNGVENQVKLDSLVNNLEGKVKERTSQIVRLEQKDMLTEINNRNSFVSKVELLLNDPFDINQPIHSVLYIDMRGFKVINDTYGHIFGDYVLSTLGKRLTDIDRYYDSISGRWGSDEFIVYLAANSRIAIKEFLKYLEESLIKEIKQNNIKVTPTFHIGVYTFKEDIEVLDAIRNAYNAVREGKQNNIKVCHFNDEIQLKNQRKEYLRNAMEQSIDGEGFYMNYQPIVSVPTNEIAGFEALVRWNLNGEFISPAEFIDIAEEHGLIIPLGRFVLKTSIAMLHRINQDFPDKSMSINVSVIQFLEDDFVEYLDFLVSKYDVNTQNIHLEITETVMIENLEKLSRVIRETKKRGVSISIDDFGTGFSSISVLKSLDVDYIKIDKMYIDHICNDDRDENIVDAVTKMSHLIGCKVIAEGIEEPEQLARLHDLQADYYQGYYFSKPVDDDSALNLLK
ncbi:bifunctional diguanylate cyclase/phosphodiesterase [Vibrio sp.]|nr:bifunctional diguanylate cyclase/phosphodiesterase [Vibrio sp.]